MTPEQEQRYRAENKKSRALDEAHRSNRAKNENVNKLLLLGAGESGKSTLFKQMIMLYGTDDDKNMNEEERKAFIPLIWGNVCTNAHTLADASHTHGPAETAEGKEISRMIEAELGEDIPRDEHLTNELAQQLKVFWADPGIQKCYDNRANYQLNDSTKYFMERLDQISQPTWIPSMDDILRTRVRTTGIVEHNFEIDLNQFRMFDVGGQRNERKKWIHCFENVTAVMFVAAISEFDQVLFEDDCTNRLSEALGLFENICSSEWFKHTPMILFLNKEDLFRDKIALKDIRDSACPELKAFTGDPRDFVQTSEFIKECFVGPNEVNGRQIYAYVTCATNTENVSIVFETVKEIIINISLEEAGLA